MSLGDVANFVAGTASLEVGEEEGGWNQPRSLGDIDSFYCVGLHVFLYYWHYITSAYIEHVNAIRR